MNDQYLHGLIGRGGAGVIKEIQRGVASFPKLKGATSVNVSISEVDLSCAILKLEYQPNQHTSPNKLCIMGKLTSSTQFNVSRDAGDFQPIDAIYWEVIEFENVKSIQRGDVVLPSASPQSLQTVNISEIDPVKSLIFASFKTNEIQVVPSEAMMGYRIYNSTSIQFTRQNGEKTAHWQVIEFK